VSHTQFCAAMVMTRNILHRLSRPTASCKTRCDSAVRYVYMSHPPRVSAKLKLYDAQYVSLPLRFSFRVITLQVVRHLLRERDEEVVV